MKMQAYMGIRMKNEAKDHTGLICKWALILAVGIMLTIYLTHSEWYDKRGSEGSYSAGEYLDGGREKLTYRANQRIYYEFEIENGGVIFDLLDENDNVVYRVGAVQSRSGYIVIGEDVAPRNLLFPRVCNDC